MLRRRAPRAAIALVALVLQPFTAGPPAADTLIPTDIEYQIKASFVYTVAKFVDWPERAFPDPGAPLTFGILGTDTVSEAIAAALKGKRVHDRPLVVRHLGDPSRARECQIVYVSGPDSAGLPGVLGAIASAGVLTVGEARGFTERGGILELTLRESMVQFEVNIAAAQKAGLVISSKILRLGRVVGDPRPAGGEQP